ncbi:unnamed protein product [Prunus armeniaca]|uniref:Uncharacterized protein n=1 Tax=Prunus armeniaca TaxID=36596 RepID=A0A6J5UJ07_PRUAR|nr:unnamed protein product [Prunus armeniaca]
MRTACSSPPTYASTWSVLGYKLVFRGVECLLLKLSNFLIRGLSMCFKQGNFLRSACSLFFFTVLGRVELLLCCIDTLQSNMGMANAYSMINQELQNSVSEKEYQEFKFFTTAEEKSGWLDGQGMEAMGWGR